MILYYLFLLTGAIILLFSEKGDWVIWMNERGTGFLDTIFSYLTWFGDGLIFILPLVLFILRSYLYLFITLAAIIIQTIFVQGLKRIVFSDIVRPKLFFEDFTTFRQIEGVEFYSNNAFPSGHTATAFTCALIFSLYLKDKRWSLLFFLVAIGVGISRIYLLQHFFIDIYFGSVFGIISVLLAVYLIMGNRYLTDRFSGKSLLTGR